jgi:hypothetical protein
MVISSIFIQDSDGNTILHTLLLSFHQRTENMQFLLNDCHADFLTIKNKVDQTAWDIAGNDHSYIYTLMEHKRRQQIYSSILFFCHTDARSSTSTDNNNDDLQIMKRQRIRKTKIVPYNCNSYQTKSNVIPHHNVLVSRQYI